MHDLANSKANENAIVVATMRINIAESVLQPIYAPAFRELLRSIAANAQKGKTANQTRPILTQTFQQCMSPLSPSITNKALHHCVPKHYSFSGARVTFSKLQGHANTEI